MPATAVAALSCRVPTCLPCCGKGLLAMHYLPSHPPACRKLKGLINLLASPAPVQPTRCDIVPVPQPCAVPPVLTRCADPALTHPPLLQAALPSCRLRCRPAGSIPRQAQFLHACTAPDPITNPAPQHHHQPAPPTSRDRRATCAVTVTCVLTCWLPLHGCCITVLQEAAQEDGHRPGPTHP